AALLDGLAERVGGDVVETEQIEEVQGDRLGYGDGGAAVLIGDGAGGVEQRLDPGMESLVPGLVVGGAVGVEPGEPIGELPREGVHGGRAVPDVLVEALDVVVAV